MMIGRVHSSNEIEFNFDTALSTKLQSLKSVNTGNFILDGSLLNGIKMKTDFKEVRIFCRKEFHPRIFHAVFRNEKFLEYLVGNVDSMTWTSCRDGVEYLSDDDSYIDRRAPSCSTESSDISRRLYEMVFIGNTDTKRYVQVGNKDNTRLECDDINTVNKFTKQGIWKYYIR